MKIRFMLIACALTVLTGCGFADQYSVMPKFLRQPSAEPPPPKPELDVKELVRVGAHKMFTTPPSSVAVSPPRRITERRFSVCVKALAPGLLDSETRAATLLVIIEDGKLSDRRRATSYDHCETETYEKVNAQVAQ
jgi:hypothetical protein